MSAARNNKKASTRDGAGDVKSSGASQGAASSKAAQGTDSATSANDGSEADSVEPGMAVETSEGDLGDHDVSTARVKDVERDAAGDVTNVVVEKGVVFRKKLDIPAERIEAVEPASGESNVRDEAGRSGTDATDNPADAGKVVVSASKQEVRDLSATGTERLGSDESGESGEASHKTGQGAPPTDRGTAAAGSHETGQASTHRGGWLRLLGPGLLSGMAGNDSSAVTSYSVNGATNGYRQLWLIVLATPLYQAVQYACAKIGRTTQKGLADILREHYGQRIAVPASLILVLANVALIAADLVAIGTGIQLVTGIAWEWFVVPVAAGLWYLIVFQNFRVIKRIFLAMGFVFAAYLVTGVVSGADWGAVLRATFVPHLSLSIASIASAVALLGATVSPYTMYWQVQGETEQKRPGSRKHQLRLAAIDIVAGTISGNLVAYAIIVCTSATLYAHHKTIHTAADAAASLAPLLGPYAEELFAVGFIGSGLVAIPVLLASTSFGLSGVFGWSASLWRKPWQSEGFYLIMTGALIVSLIVALLRFDPIQLMFWANVLQGILAPVLIVFIFLVGNNRKIMRGHRIGLLTNIGLVVVALVMSAATVLFFVGLFTGRGT